MDDVQPSFDVFGLAKLLWSMLSGKQFLRLWYFDRPEFNLEAMDIFQRGSDVRWATRIFRKCIVEHEGDCVLKNAGELLALIDESLQALQRGGQVLRGAGPNYCRICGLGTYQWASEEMNAEMRFVCDSCGHWVVFSGTRLIRKRAWE